MQKSPYLSAALLLLATPAGYAGETIPIVMTPTRTAETVNQALASVTVITRQDIERRQAQSVQDILRGVSGVVIANSGGAGKATSVYLRGTEASHVLVLVDGIKVGSATAGTTAFQDLPIDQIEKIEVVRGPRSSLYGSEAIGGVIQIFTRKGGGELTPSLSLGAGSDQTYKASAGLSGGSDRSWYSINASGLTTEGFNACDGKPSPGGAGCFTVEPDRDGYRNRAVSAHGGYRFEAGAELDLHAQHSQGDLEFDGSFVNESETAQQIVGATLRFSPADFWQIKVASGRSRDESDNFKDSVFKTRFDTERDSVSWQNDFAIGADHLLSLGVDYLNDKVESTTAYNLTSRDNTGIFIQHQAVFGDHDMQLSLRTDDNEQFGNHTTGGAAWGYTLNADLRLTASYGTAFKAPTFNDLYFPLYGNPDLQPSKSRSLELGLAGGIAIGQWSVDVYETRLTDLIAYDSTLGLPNNINQSRIYGLEATLVAQLDNWDINTSLTLLDPTNRSGSYDDKLLPRRAQQTLSLDVDRMFGKHRLGLTLHAQSHRYDDLANTRRLGGYATLGLRGEYALATDWRLKARIDNLFDKDYETVSYFNQPGRSLFVSLHYQP